MINLYSFDGSTLKLGSVAIINGLMYKDEPCFLGIHSSSIFTSSTIACKKSFSSISGMHNLLFELFAL